MLLDDTPEWQAPLLLRIAQHGFKNLLRVLSRNKCLERLNTRREQRVIACNGCRGPIGAGEQITLLFLRFGAALAHPVIDAACQACRGQQRRSA